MDVTEVIAYKCNKCGVCYTAKDAAETRCAKSKPKPKRFCKDCGEELDSDYYTLCDTCSEKRNYNKCRKMSVEEYEKEFTDYMVYVDDTYYSSVEEVIEYFRDNREDIPSYVYGTKKCYSELDVDYAIENAESDAYEDAESDAYEDAKFDSNAVDELYKYIEEWNNKNAIEYYTVADIIIEIPEDLINKIKSTNRVHNFY